MNTKRIKIICLMLAAVFAVALAAGCRKSSQKAQNPVHPSDNWTAESGLHNVSVTATGKTLFNDGATVYKIIRPAVNSANYQLAVSELKGFLEAASGVLIEVVDAGSLTYAAGDKYISVGDNAYAASAGVEYDYDVLGANGLRIVTKGDSIFLGGTTEYGTLNAVYEFLSHTIGFEIYAADEIVYKESGKIELYNFDVTEVPDFQWRVLPSASLGKDPVFARRMRFNAASDVWMKVEGVTWHNTFKYLPKATYQTAHPEWYASDGTQLCFTARGSEKHYKEFSDTFFAKLVEVVKSQPSLENVTITHEDSHTWCSCEACSAEKTKYGTDAAVMIKFSNDMGARLKEWIANNNEGVPKDRVVNICFFAYNKTEAAPVTKNAAGEYVAIDDSVKCSDNVFVFYAPIDIKFTKTYTDDLNNVYADIMDAWNVVSDRIYLWVYQTNFLNYLFPYNNFPVMQENYKFAKSRGVYYIFDQGQHDQGASTALHEFKSWLNSKLQWNVNLDVKELTKKYFDNYFRDASEAMTEYYKSLVTWMTYLEGHEHVTGSIYFAINDGKYFPKGVLDGWSASVDRAYAAIEKYKDSDPQLYTKVSNRICLESIFVRHVYITEYSGRFSGDVLAEMKSSFKTDVQRLGITNIHESLSISGLLEDY